MKIALSARGTTLDDFIEERFGRAPTFIIYNLEEDSYHCIDITQVLSSAQGAGIQAAQHVADEGIEAVVTGHVGPKAFKVLTTANVKIYLTRGIKVKEAISSFKKGELEQAENNDVEEHWV